MTEGSDPVSKSILVDMSDESEPMLCDDPIAEGDHLLEVPGRIDVVEWEGDRRGIEGLSREVEDDGRVLADRIEQDRVAEGRCRLSEDLYRFVLEFSEDARGAQHGVKPRNPRLISPAIDSAATRPAPGPRIRTDVRIPFSCPARAVPHFREGSTLAVGGLPYLLDPCGPKGPLQAHLHGRNREVRNAP